MLKDFDIIVKAPATVIAHVRIPASTLKEALAAAKDLDPTDLFTRWVIDDVQDITEAKPEPKRRQR